MLSWKQFTSSTYWKVNPLNFWVQTGVVLLMSRSRLLIASNIRQNLDFPFHLIELQSIIRTGGGIYGIVSHFCFLLERNQSTFSIYRKLQWTTHFDIHNSLNTWSNVEHICKFSKIIWSRHWVFLDMYKVPRDELIP